MQRIAERWLQRLAAASYIGLILACTPSVHAHSTRFQHFAAKPADSEIAIYSGSTLECPFVEVGLVSAEGSRHHTDAILDGLKKEARILGGDAIVGLSESTTVRGAVPAGNIAVAIRRQVLSGTVIRFAGADCAR